MFTDDGIAIVCITMKLLVGECLREERCLEMTNKKEKIMARVSLKPLRYCELMNN